MTSCSSRAVGLGIRFGTFVLVASLAACGGGGDPAPSAETVAAESAAPGRMQALAATSTQQVSTAAIANPTAADLFEWAQWKWPMLFPAGPIQVEKDVGGTSYAIRGYATGIFLAVGTTTGAVYALLPRPADPLISLGTLATFAAEISADSCTFRPGSCDPTPAGPYNECVDPAALALPTGFRTHLVYQYSGLITGEQTVDSEIDGADNFEGQSAIKAKSTTQGSNTSDGLTVTSSTEESSFMQIAGDGLLNTLGGIVKFTSETTSPELPFPFRTESESKFIFTPPMRNVEFTLRVGESVTKTNSLTTVILSGFGAGTTTGPDSTSETHTFVAREQVSVLGRSYDACRYTMVTSGVVETTTTWYLVGKGIPVKTQSPGQLIELKSGTYNGAPL
jgi:hypothetical protein